MSKPTLVFWLLLRVLVDVIASLLTSVALNVREVLLVFILVLVLLDSSVVDASGRGILALALLLGSFSARTIILVFFELCRGGLAPT